MVFPLGHPGMISKIKMMYNNNQISVFQLLQLPLTLGQAGTLTKFSVIRLAISIEYNYIYL